MKSMSPSRLNKLLQRRAATAYKMNQIRAELDPAIEERYGCHPGDIDCDPAIEVLDYGVGGKYSLKELDADMTECGHPPLTPPDNA